MITRYILASLPYNYMKAGSWRAHRICLYAYIIKFDVAENYSDIILTVNDASLSVSLMPYINAILMLLSAHHLVDVD